MARAESEPLDLASKALSFILKGSDATELFQLIAAVPGAPPKCPGCAVSLGSVYFMAFHLFHNTKAAHVGGKLHHYFSVSGRTKKPVEDGLNVTFVCVLRVKGRLILLLSLPQSPMTARSGPVRTRPSPSVTKASKTAH